MDFKQLEIFITLVKNESFSMTADELGISQPTVSLNIKQLEEELDTALFIRSTRELKLTDDGRKLFGEAENLISRRNRVLDTFGEKNKRKLSIGVSTISASYILPKVLEKYHENFPKIKVDIKETNSLVTIKKVSEYEVDLGIVGMKKENENCEFEPIFQDEFVFICPNTEYYKKLKDSKPTIKELAKEPLIIREQGSGIKDNMDKLLAADKVKVKDLNVVMTVNDEELIKKLTSMGLGTSFISKVAVEELIEEGKIIAISLENYKERFRNLYAVWNKKVTYPSYVREMLKYIKECE